MPGQVVPATGGDGSSQPRLRKKPAAIAGGVRGAAARAVQGACRSATRPMKTIFLSKTFWTQVLALAVMLFPEVRLWVSENPVEFTAAWAAINTLVRFATSGKVSLAGGGQVDAAGPLGGAGLLVIMGAAGLFLTALPSCGVPIRATVLLPEGAVSYSAKGGLELQVDRRSGK